MALKNLFSALSGNRQKTRPTSFEIPSVNRFNGNTSRRSENGVSTYTIDEAIEKLGFGPFQFKLTLICGLVLTADAMEIMLLSILGPSLACDWLINKWEMAFLSTVVFIGWSLGGPIWGKFCDQYGRRMGLLVSTFFTFYFGFLSSMAPNYTWLVLMRGLVGFGIGGSAQTFTLFSEFSPKEMRAKSALWLLFFWPIGTSLEVFHILGLILSNGVFFPTSMFLYIIKVGLAIVIKQWSGWRWLLVVSSIPSFIAGCLCLWLPESARYNIENGRTNKAIDTLRDISSMNKIRLPTGVLKAEEKQTSGKFGRVGELLSGKYRAEITVKLWFIWFTNAFMFYGIVLLTNQIFYYGNSCDINPTDDQCLMRCMKLDDYYDLFYTGMFEFPALLISWYLVEKIGRTVTLSLGFAFASVLLLSMNVCFERSTLIVILAFVRCSILVTFQSTYIYSPELYPTTVRAQGMGFCTGMARLGAIITPYLALVLYRDHPNIVMSIYGFVNFVATFLPLTMPETKNRKLGEWERRSQRRSENND